ncbi:MAG: hypothetical protein JNJ44_00825 [Zoogloeaceae bacterium]|nr:hypothetical protein [Zoogloeaceae bacterium]
MSVLRLLYLDAAGLTAYAWQAGEVIPLARFSTGEDGPGQFAQFLATQPRNAVYRLLADLVEESFFFETLPAVRGSDRSAMLARKRSQHFFGSPYATELALGREEDGRRDERFLFTGITRPAALEPWLDAMARHEVALASLHTLPTLADGMPAPFSAKDAAPRLILILTAAGIRQIFFDNGRLRFSRLAPRTDLEAGTLALALSEEAARTQAYLSSQRLFPRHETLPVVILANPELQAPLTTLLDAPAQTHFSFADLPTLARQIGLRSPCSDSRATPLFLHWMVRRGGGVQLAPRSARHFYVLRQMRMAALGLGSAIFVGCALVAAKLWVDTLSLGQEIDRLQLESRSDAARYTALVESLPPLPVSLESLQTIMARVDGLASERPNPRPALAALATALDTMPELTLDEVEWRSLPALAGAIPPRPSAELAVKTHFPLEGWQDRRALLRDSERFLQLLQQTPGIRAEITRLPMDLASDRTLRGATNVPATQAAPTLELRITVVRARTS